MGPQGYSRYTDIVLDKNGIDVVAGVVISVLKLGTLRKGGCMYVPLEKGDHMTS